VNRRDNDERDREELLKTILRLGREFEAALNVSPEIRFLKYVNREIDQAMLGTRYGLIQPRVLMTEFGTFPIKSSHILARWVLSGADQLFLLSIGIGGV
jgi:hypothetical protein